MRYYMTVCDQLCMGYKNVWGIIYCLGCNNEWGVIINGKWWYTKVFGV